MTFRRQIKITVLKKLNGEEIYGKKLPLTPKFPLICDVLNEGDEFTVDETGAMPRGFCTWAWDDLARLIVHLQLGGEVPWFEEKGAALSCCTDAIRPVIFKLEKK